MIHMRPYVVRSFWWIHYPISIDFSLLSWQKKVKEKWLQGSPHNYPNSASFIAKSGIKTNSWSVRRICIFKRRKSHSKVIDPHLTTVDGSTTHKRKIRRFMLILLVIVYFRRKSVYSFSSSLFKWSEKDVSNLNSHLHKYNASSSLLKSSLANQVGLS